MCATNQPLFAPNEAATELVNLFTDITPVLLTPAPGLKGVQQGKSALPQSDAQKTNAGGMTRSVSGAVLGFFAVAGGALLL